MIVTSVQDLKFRKKTDFPTLFYFLINNALFLAHNKKMTEKSVFLEDDVTIIVSCFWSRGFVPHRKWNFTFLVHQNTGKKNRYRIYFLLYLSLHCGDFIEQLKKHPSYTLSVLKQFNQMITVFFSVNMSLSLTVFPDPFWVSLTRIAAILKTCYKYAWNRPYSLYRHVCFRIIMLILLVTNYS